MIVKPNLTSAIQDFISLIPKKILSMENLYVKFRIIVLVKMYVSLVKTAKTICFEF